MRSLFQRNGQKMYSLLRLIIFISIWRIVNSAARNAPFCIDADDTKEDLRHGSERFQSIIEHVNQHNPPVQILGSSPAHYISEMRLTRMVVDDNILPTTFHTMRNLRNWVHITMTAREGLVGLYVQAMKAPLGVPFGNFVIDFECRDCYGVPSSGLNTVPTAQIVPCKGRPKSSARHPDVLVVAGLDVDPAYVMEHGFHFHFNWIEGLCDDVPLFQFLIVAVKSFDPIVFQTYWSHPYENEMADTWTGVPWPLDPTWTHNDTIACHGGHGLQEQILQISKSTRNASGIIRVNEEYDNCLTSDAMTESYQCPPGPFACDNPPQNKDVWLIRRQRDIENALKICSVCNDAHSIRKRAIEDQDDDLELDGSADELEQFTNENKLDRSTGKDELGAFTNGPGKRTDLGLGGGGGEADLGEVGSRNVQRDVGTGAKPPTHPQHHEENLSFDSGRRAPNRRNANQDLDYPVQRLIGERRTGRNSVKIKKSDPETVSYFEHYFIELTKLLYEDIVKAHSILMVLCWCTFSSISSYLARFHKEMTTITPGSGCCSLGSWLWGHTIFSYMSLAAMWAGVVLVFPLMVILPGTYGKNETHSSVAHTVIGAIAMTFFHFNLILGWYRPISPSLRGIYILGHVILGYGSKFLAVVAAFKSTLSTDILLFIILAEAFNIIIYIVATIVLCKIDQRLAYEPPRSYFPVPEGIDTYDPDYKKTSGINSCLLFLQNPILLYIHYILQLIPCIVFIILVCQL